MNNFSLNPLVPTATFETAVEPLRQSVIEALIAPGTLRSELPASTEVVKFVRRVRFQIDNLIAGRDKRLLVIAGPCSIHDFDEAMEYARRFKVLAAAVEERVVLVMRVYFQKQRTTLGWKGLIEDPALDGGSDINAGLRLARKTLLAINELGVPCAAEFVDGFVPRYIEELIVWSAIGARTAESQIHRELASCLEMPVGIKNTSDGSWQNAFNGIKAARQPQTTFSINEAGEGVILRSLGNPSAHLVLRGGAAGPNYGAEHVRAAATALQKFSPGNQVLVDCSHGNSGKDYRRQPVVFLDVLEQITSGQPGILGLMLESNLNEGSQAWNTERNFQHGVSITDSCISWQTTEELVRTAYDRLGKV